MGCVGSFLALFEDTWTRFRRQMKATYGVSLVLKEGYKEGTVIGSMADLFELCDMQLHDEFCYEDLKRATQFEDDELRDAIEHYNELVAQDFKGESLVQHILASSGVDEQVGRLLCATLKPGEEVYFPVLMSIVSTLVRGSRAEKLAFLFSLFDFDSSGSLSHDEVHGVVRLACRGRLTEDEIDELVDTLFDQFDRKATGEIHFEVFLESYPLICEALGFENDDDDSDDSSDSEGSWTTGQTLQIRPSASGMSAREKRGIRRASSVSVTRAQLTSFRSSGRTSPVHRRGSHAPRRSHVSTASRSSLASLILPVPSGHASPQDAGTTMQKRSSSIMQPSGTPLQSRYSVVSFSDPPGSTLQGKVSASAFQDRRPQFSLPYLSISRRDSVPSEEPPTPSSPCQSTDFSKVQRLSFNSRVSFASTSSKMTIPVARHKRTQKHVSISVSQLSAGESSKSRSSFISASVSSRDSLRMTINAKRYNSGELNRVAHAVALSRADRSELLGGGASLSSQAIVGSTVRASFVGFSDDEATEMQSDGSSASTTPTASSPKGLSLRLPQVHRFLE
ncbi:hypothetical protein DIPPA_09567 [Diplonema papillatum]|nr:hypothetical protein DIPPA_09567 [Diplonema papillatum]